VAEKHTPTDGGGIIARIEARADTGERRVIDHGYNTDLARWAENQAAALRAAAGTSSDQSIDWENVAEEALRVASRSVGATPD
jgi:hypothetical protein